MSCSQRIFATTTATNAEPLVYLFVIRWCAAGQLASVPIHLPLLPIHKDQVGLPGTSRQKDRHAMFRVNHIFPCGPPMVRLPLPRLWGYGRLRLTFARDCYRARSARR